MLTANGHAEVSCATSDIGTGTYTIMAQVAADMLGVPLENVTVKLGNSTLPQSPVEGGSWTAASVSHAIVNAARDIRQALLRLAAGMPNSKLAGAKADGVSLSDGRIVVTASGDAVSIADVLRHGQVDRIEQESSTDFKNDTETPAMLTRRCLPR